MDLENGFWAFHDRRSKEEVYIAYIIGFSVGLSENFDIICLVGEYYEIQPIAHASRQGTNEPSSFILRIWPNMCPWPFVNRTGPGIPNDIELLVSPHRNYL